MIIIIKESNFVKSTEQCSLHCILQVKGWSCHTTYTGSVLAASCCLHQIQDHYTLLSCCSWPHSSLSELVSPYQPGRSVRSAHAIFLIVPCITLERFSCHSFSFAYVENPATCLLVQWECYVLLGPDLKTLYCNWSTLTVTFSTFCLLSFMFLPMFIVCMCGFAWL